MIAMAVLRDSADKGLNLPYQSGFLAQLSQGGALGSFAELEGERSDIVRLAKTLGFSPAQMIKRDYVELIQEAGKAD
jgi:adenylate cyclase class IV